MKTAKDLNIGDTAIIKGFTNIQYTRKFLSLGFRPNNVIKVIRKSPFGKNYYIEHQNQFIALRSTEAAFIEII